MASTFALHNELVASIVRGFQRLQDIEYLRSVSDAEQLEDRMAASAELTDPTAGTAPTPLEIRLACEAIQANWSDWELETRSSRTPFAVARSLTREELKARHQEKCRNAHRRIADRRELAGKSRYKRRGEREAVAC